MNRLWWFYFYLRLITKDEMHKQTPILRKHYTSGFRLVEMEYQDYCE